MIATLQPIADIEYPVRDDEPLAETDLHAQETIALFQALQEFFSAAADVYVAMDNFIYFEKGNPAACLSPDVYVVKGAASRLRDCYKAWEEDGRPPAAVFEITSSKTKKNDQGPKKQTCQRLGVQEYFLFDPKAEYLKPNLRGFQLLNGVYAPIKAASDGALVSAELRLKFNVSPEGLLRVTDPASGRILPRKREEAQALRAAEAEIARLKEELARLKK